MIKYAFFKKVMAFMPATTNRGHRFLYIARAALAYISKKPQRHPNKIFNT